MQGAKGLYQAAQPGPQRHNWEFDRDNATEWLQLSMEIFDSAKSNNFHTEW
jgi:hypothetical protein